MYKVTLGHGVTHPSENRWPFPVFMFLKQSRMALAGLELS